MHLCYLDESGSAETYTQLQPTSTPAFVLIGLSVAAARQKSLAMKFLQLKQQFEPHLAGSRLTDVIRHEVKGSSLRADLRRTGEADTWSAHHSERYSDIKERFGARIARLEHRYVDDEGITRGGFHVVDPVNRRPTHLLFRG